MINWRECALPKEADIEKVKRINKEWHKATLSFYPKDASVGSQIDKVYRCHQKRLEFSFKPFLRYLADSNCRRRFCRPLPSHSVKVP